MRAGALREDFWDRISDVLITVPPLRQRTEDIPLLVQYFIEKYNPIFRRRVESLTKLAIARLQSHSWPGNVRELESAVKRALLMCDEDVLAEEHFELRAGAGSSAAIEGLVSQVWDLVSTGRVGFGDVVEFKTAWGTEITAGVVARALKASGGSQKRAGALLGVYEDADNEKARYSKFRSDLARLRAAKETASPVLVDDSHRVKRGESSKRV
jgi:two-component system nitrogen regulation response regulator GlnG